MKVESVKTDALIPYAFNNKKHPDSQVDMIANSIREFGFNQPIVVDEDSIVLVGHGRLLAAKKLGLEEVPVYRAADLSEAQKKAYRILDNKLAGDAEWDFENIAIEFEQLIELGFDVADWGLEKLLPKMPESVEGQEFDESIADGVIASATFKVTIPVEDSDSFEQRLDEILQRFPTAKKEKKI
jgi:ParB-like nuclease domain